MNQTYVKKRLLRNPFHPENYLVIAYADEVNAQYEGGTFTMLLLEHGEDHSARIVPFDYLVGYIEGFVGLSQPEAQDEIISLLPKTHPRYDATAALRVMEREVHAQMREHCVGVITPSRAIPKSELLCPPIMWDEKDIVDYDEYHWCDELDLVHKFTNQQVLDELREGPLHKVLVEALVTRGGDVIDNAVDSAIRRLENKRRESRNDSA